MTTLTLAVILHASTLIAAADVAAPAAETYTEAHRKTDETGQPMVVMVGADWCPACQSMEQNILPQVRKRGILRRVAFAVVNFDRERDLATKLTNGGPIPQLIVFRKTDSGWNRRVLVGGQTVEQVESFIGDATQADAIAKKAAPAPQNAGDAQPAKGKLTSQQTTKDENHPAPAPQPSNSRS